jgi:hypothetical protein
MQGKSSSSTFSFFGRLWRSAVEAVTPIPAMSMAEENRGEAHVDDPLVNFFVRLLSMAV